MKIQNITDTDMTGKYTFPTPNGGTVKGIELFVADIPNVATISWLPGQIIDLGLITTTAQIDQSRHLRVHILEGRMIVVP
jgi:hypothetical protein